MMDDRLDAYIFVDNNKLYIGNGCLEAEIEIGGEVCLAGLFNKLTGRRYLFGESMECVLRLGVSEYRIDIPGWKFCPGSGEDVHRDEEFGLVSGFQGSQLDDSEWMGAGRINEWPIGNVFYATVTYPGYGWYRHSFALPADAEGKSIELGLGGYDTFEWLEYWVYINGELVGQSAPSGYWHDSPKYVLSPGDEAYKCLKFGSSNVLAVQTKGLDRRFPGMSEPDAERYSPHSIVADQYISVGDATRDISAFKLLNHTESVVDGRADVHLLLANDEEQLQVDVHYWVNQDEPVIHKQIAVENLDSAEKTLLEIDMQRLKGGFTASGGAQGFPCNIGNDVFCGIRHPSGISVGWDDSVYLGTLPGRKLAPGEIYQSKEAVFGVSNEGEAGQAFVRHLETHCARKNDLIQFYHSYGIHDVAGLDNPTYLTEELVMDSLDNIEDLRKYGVDFEYYFLDAGWSNPHGDLTDFDPRFFPDGPAKVTGRIKDMGMKLGLWTSPACGPHAFYPNVKNDLLEPSMTEKNGWALCVASEPWHSLYRDAILHHIRVNNVSGIKLDGGMFVCNNPEHDHLPGKYSTETIMDSTLQIFADLRVECPDLFVMYYWNTRSPWWLLWGDTIYERGVLMEGATPSDTPSRELRQSVTISLDQVVQHAWDLVPLASSDSLGVWLSNTRWASYMGAEGWRDSWVMDIARGSMLSQMWGDLNMLDSEDRQLWGRVWTWLRNCKALRQKAVRILGSPWESEPYGYAYADSEQAAVFVYNPSFDARQITLDMGELSETLKQSCEIKSIYPEECGLGVLSGGKFSMWLKPWEVKLLSVVPAGNESVGQPYVDQPCEQLYLRLPCDFKEESREVLSWDDEANQPIIGRVVRGREQVIYSDDLFRQAKYSSDERDRHVSLRKITGKVGVQQSGNRMLIVSVKTSRDGVSWHHHCLHEMMTMRISAAGSELEVIPSQSMWHEQAGGRSWINFVSTVPDEDCELNIELDAYLPDAVDVELEILIN